MPTPKPAHSIDAFLAKMEPSTVRSNLVLASLFLAGWEMLKLEVQDRVRDFYQFGIEPGQVSDYQERVLSRDPESRFKASLLWLVESDALTAQQAERVLQLRELRNTIAHELPKLLTEPGHDISLAHVRDLKDMIDAIGRFWGQIEVDTNPDFDGKRVDPADIQSGISLLMGHLVAVAEATAADP